MDDQSRSDVIVRVPMRGRWDDESREQDALFMTLKTE